MAVADLMTGMYSTVGILALTSAAAWASTWTWRCWTARPCQPEPELHDLRQGAGRLATRTRTWCPRLRRQRRPPDRGRATTASSAYCGVIGLPELSADPRFSTNPQRVKNREELVPLLAERMAQARARPLAGRVGRRGRPVRSTRWTRSTKIAGAGGAAMSCRIRQAGAQPAEAVRQPGRYAPARPCWASTRRRCCPRSWACR